MTRNETTQEVFSICRQIDAEYEGICQMMTEDCLKKLATETRDAMLYAVGENIDLRVHNPSDVVAAVNKFVGYSF